MANEVVHFEINGKNIDTLKAFYTGLFGWQAQDWPMPTGNPYVGFDTKEVGGIGGGMTAAPEGAPAMATCYVSVDDLAATLAAVEAAGGQTVVPITDVGMVVFALFADPQGNVVGIVKTDPGEAMPEHSHEQKEGAVGWFELSGADGNALREFYTKVFGWEFQVDPQFGYGMASPGGDCGVGVGGSPDGKSHVTFYINTSDVAGKLKEVEAKGGHTVMGAEDMGMVEIGLFVDPDGALIGLMKPKQQ